MSYSYKTQGVCSRNITFDIREGRVYNVRFDGGCNGNTQGIAGLVDGMTVDEVVERLSGIRCGFKDTSCPDQLATALTKALKEQDNQ